MKQLLDVAGSSEHLLGARPYAHVFGEIFPTHSPRAVDQELCGTRDVMAVGASPGVQQTVPPDYVQLGSDSKVKVRLALCCKLLETSRRSTLTATGRTPLAWNS
jgi:hypothetical protein